MKWLSGTAEVSLPHKGLGPKKKNSQRRPSSDEANEHQDFMMVNGPDRIKSVRESGQLLARSDSEDLAFGELNEGMPLKPPW